MKVLFFMLAIASTGIMAGTFFTWTNAVTPGIGKLNDMTYLSSLQSMNRVILNPIFYLFFMLPVLVLPLASYLHYKSIPTGLFQSLLVISILYIVGVFLVTAMGNVPLNEILAKTDLSTLSQEQAQQLRLQIEQPWNTYNLIRTICCSSSFFLLIFTYWYYS